MNLESEMAPKEQEDSTEGEGDRKFTEEKRKGGHRH
jgi:hypothetical protein